MDDVPGARGSELVGRRAECEVLRAFLERAAAGGDVLLVTGDRGVGRTALLDAAAASAAAAGALVLRAAGVESEADVDHAGLHQLLLPLPGGPVDPSGPRDDALAAAVSSAPAAAPGPLAVAAATSALLDRAAGGRPVLLVVDDLPELDRASARVLGLLARRLAGRRWGVLAAAGTAGDPVLRDAAPALLELGPLDDPSSAELLRARRPDLPAPVRRRVLDAARGNPLALLELPDLLAGQEPGGPLPLPPGTRLDAAFARPVGRLPAATRALLLLAALEGTGDLRTVRAAALDEDRRGDRERGGDWLDDLAPAERAGMVDVDVATGRLVLRHPLTGAAAVALATSGERRRAHAALASALVDEPERCARHLAQATVGPDAHAAGLLERSAARAGQRGDAARAVAVQLQAARLTPPGPDRAGRLAGAAAAAVATTGDLRAVPQLLAEARVADPGGGGSPAVAVATALHLLHAEGDVETAHLLLARAAAAAPGPGGAVVDDALHGLLLACHLAGREDLWRLLEDALARLGPDAPPAVSVAVRTFADPARATPADLDRLDDLLTAAQADADPARVVRAARAASSTDRLGGCRPALERVAADGRHGGAAAAAVDALALLCSDAFRRGRWDEAARTAGEAVARGADLGYRLAPLPAAYCLALLAAARGDGAAVRARVQDLTTEAVVHGVRLAGHLAAHVCGLAALGRGEFDDAHRHLSAVSAPGGFAPHVPIAPVVAMDLVEAAVRTGRRTEAEEHVAAMRRAPLFRSRPGFALLLAGAAALVAPEEDATARFEAALAVPGAERFPFDHARVRLAHGEHLRRSRATSASRVQLAAALETFERLGAAPWAARASAELRATGSAPRRPSGGPSPASLTAQEYEIAMLAATGLSNKQIGHRLYLSPRTVGAHLYRAFPKLGVTARAALRDALAAGATAGATAGTPRSSPDG
ncbi:AAA family ATPase [Geodermatophilus sp. SYSU D01045]